MRPPLQTCPGCGAKLVRIATGIDGEPVEWWACESDTDGDFNQSLPCLERERDLLAAIVAKAASDLEEIVCTKDPDRGVILKSNHSPTRWDAEAKCNVYVHEGFSPLGDALIALHGLLSAALPTSN